MATMKSPSVVGILGGMGPAAGADFARLFVQACAAQLPSLGLPVSDQSFPEHWLAQVPVPDRTAALSTPKAEMPGAHQPLDPMLQALGKLAALGATTVAVACNTAHAWHGLLQQRFPQIEVLHVAREVARALQLQGVHEVGLLATVGTYRAGLYDSVLREAGIVCHMPTEAERARLMEGIYQGVKVNKLAHARACFEPVARQLTQRHGLSTLILGCTEIPLALPAVAGYPNLQLVDPAWVLAQALAQRAYQGFETNSAALAA
jgi:aspartate racemase